MTYVVATLGTSLTLNGGWQEPLRSALEAATGRAISVLNFGAGARASDYGVTAITELLAANVDMVVAEFSINDAYGVYGISQNDSLGMTGLIVSSIRNRRKIPVLMTMNPTHGVVALERPKLAEYYAIYRIASQTMRTQLIDNEKTWMEMSQAQREAAIPDGVHPTTEAVTAVLVPNAVAVLAPLILAA